LRRGRGSQQLADLASAYFYAGRNADGDALLKELRAETESERVTPALLASVYFAAGDADTGFALLGQALERRSRAMIFLQVNQMLVGYRDDPRYQALVEKVGFR